MPTRARRLQKLTAVLDPRRRVILVGVDSTMDAAITVLRELLRRARIAAGNGVEFPAFLQALSDESGR